MPDRGCASERAVRVRIVCPRQTSYIQCDSSDGCRRFLRPDHQGPGNTGTCRKVALLGRIPLNGTITELRCTVWVSEGDLKRFLCYYRRRFLVDVRDPSALRAAIVSRILNPAADRTEAVR